MNNFELIPTEDNLIQVIRKDLFKRNKDLVVFADGRGGFSEGERTDDGG